METLQDLALPFDLIAQLVAGAVGGALAGAALKSFSLGRLWNTVAGLIGGGLGTQALLHLGMIPAGATEAETLGTSAAVGGVSGALLFVLIGLARSAARR